MDFAELFNWPEYFKLLIGLLALANPFGIVPVLLGATRGQQNQQRINLLTTSVIVFIITLIVFVFVGYLILNVFGISIAAFRIAGGVLFLFFALQMLGLIVIPDTYSKKGVKSSDSLGIVPLGIPLLAGPGTISNVILYAAIHEGIEHKLVVSGVVLATGLIVYLFVRGALALGHKLSDSTMMVINRVMGLLLAAIAVEFILDGIAAHFPGIETIH